MGTIYSDEVCALVVATDTDLVVTVDDTVSLIASNDSVRKDITRI